MSTTTPEPAAPTAAGMSAATRLALFLVALLALFAVGYGIGMLAGPLG